MQPMECTNKVLSSTSTRFNPYFGWCYHLYVLYQPKYGLNLVDVLENALSAHFFGYICLSLQLQADGLYLVTKLSIPNQFQLHGYLFPYFLLQSLLSFSNSKFYLHISLLYSSTEDMIAYLMKMKD